MSNYRESAHAYTERVQSLFATPQESVPGTVTRSGVGSLPSAQELADRAEQLLPLSDELTQSAALRLTDSSLRVRADASAKLLAKTLTDLEVGAYLLDAAWTEESGERRATAGTAVRGRGTSVSLLDIQEHLKFLLEEGAPVQPTTRRAITAVNLDTARTNLSTQVGDTLALLLERASTTGQQALAGLLGMQLSEVASAAGLVSTDIAQALGQGENLSRLYNLVREHITKAWEAIMALVGEQAMKAAGTQVVQWVEKLQKGELLGRLLEQIYNTKKTTEQLQQFVLTSQVAPEKYVEASDLLKNLSAEYQQQLVWAGRVLSVAGKVRFVVGFVPTALIPYLNLVLPAIYVATGVYVIAAGADYVDAERLKYIDRVPGVQRIVRAQLSAGSQ